MTDVVTRIMESHEFDEVRALETAAFGADPKIFELLGLLRESWAWVDELSFVAELGGDIVGHVLYTRAIVDAPTRLVEVLVLSPVGVRPDLQRTGRGIGTALISTSLEQLDSREEPLVFLEGHPGYYRRFGFRPGHELGFTAPSSRIPAVAFMARPLPRYESWMTGALVYPDAFWRTDTVGLR